MSTSLPVFIIKRLFVMMFLVFSIASIVFFLAHASPYDPVQQILGQKTSPLKRAAMRHLFGLDQPLWRQYINYLGNALHGNLGYAEENFYFGQSVSKILLRGLPVSVKLGGYALALSGITRVSTTRTCGSMGAGSLLAEPRSTAIRPTLRRATVNPWVLMLGTKRARVPR